MCEEDLERAIQLVFGGWDKDKSQMEVCFSCSADVDGPELGTHETCGAFGSESFLPVNQRVQVLSDKLFGV